MSECDSSNGKIRFFIEALSRYIIYSDILNDIKNVIFFRNSDPSAQFAVG